MRQTRLPLWTLILSSVMLILASCAPSVSVLDDSGLTAEPDLVTAQPTEQATEEAAPTREATPTNEVTEEPTFAPDVLPTTEALPTGEGSMTPSTPDGSSGAAAPSDLIGSMIADLSRRLSIEAAQISVASATPVTWNDGSLGCPEPGAMYTQALVPGYQVILEAGGQRYPYHASERGEYKLCVGGPILPSSGTNPSH